MIKHPTDPFGKTFTSVPPGRMVRWRRTGSDIRGATYDDGDDEEDEDDHYSYPLPSKGCQLNPKGWLIDTL